MRALVILLCLAVCLIQLGAAAPAEAGSKSASTQPLSVINDLAFDATNFQTLTWTYYVDGDYDQNGEVGVSDITPVGLHFGKTTAAADWGTACVADGDCNGEVNASDLTRIGLNFGATVSEFMVLSAPSETGPFVGGAGTVVAFDSVPKPAGGGPRPFEFELASPTPGFWYCVVARDAAGEATDYSNMVQYVPGNLPPQAVISFTADPVSPPGVWIIFAGGDSSDPDGIITEYEWDLEGTGEFTSSGAVGMDSHVYSQPGTYHPVLRVTDDGGATDTVEGDAITVSLGDMKIHTLDSSHIAGIEVCATNTVDGLPCAAYLAESANLDLKFIAPVTIKADLWPAPTLIDSNPGAAMLDICRNADGDLIVACQQGSGTLARYHGAQDGSTWGLPATTRGQDSAQYGYHNSLLLVNENISYAYRDNLERIWYTYYHFGFWHIEVTPYGSHGERPALASVGGLPAMVYSNLAGGADVELYFTQAEDNTGSIWSNPVALVAGGRVQTNRFSLTELFSSQALVVYYDQQAQSLNALATTDYLDIAWTDPMTLDASAQVGQAFSVAVVNALPCVAYTDAASKELRLVYGRDRSGHSWIEPIVLTSNSSGFLQIALVQRDRYPHVFFQDKDDNNLKAVVFRAATP